MSYFDSRLLDPRAEALVITERERADIVVGAPHHAILGVTNLPCPDHEVSDENAGLLTAIVAEWIGCHSIVGVNATVDLNKDLTSPYAAQVRAWAPRLLVEIHGHGGVRAKYDVEISAGTPQRSMTSELFADMLREEMAARTELAHLTVSGRWSDIYFRASSTPTIANAPWHALHIELPPAVRKGTAQELVPAAGHLLASHIARQAVALLDQLPVLSGGTSA
jgi:hypothetical protein